MNFVMKEDICKRITIIRNNLGMNKNEFANFLEITPQYLGTIESGENCLSVEKIILLSQKANISTDYILLGREHVIDENMIKDILSINEEQLDLCLSIIRSIVTIINSNK